MVFAKPKVVKKPLKTVWCLDQSEVQDQSEEKERTSVGFLSSGRKANLSQLELDDIFEEELEINNLVEGQHDPTEDYIQSEITLEKEFLEFPGVSSTDFSENLLDFEFEETGETGETGETQSPIITVGLSATARPRNMRARQTIVERQSSSPLPARLSRPPHLQVRRRDSPPILDSRIGLPNLNFLRVRENHYDTQTNLIGPVKPDFIDIKQSLFQTRF